MRLPDSTKMRVLLAHLRHCRVSMRHQASPATLSHRDADGDHGAASGGAGGKASKLAQQQLQQAQQQLGGGY